MEAGSILAGGPLVKVGKVSDGLNALEHAQGAVNELDRAAGLVLNEVIAAKSETIFGPVRPGLDVPQGLTVSQFDRISGKVRAAVDSMGLGDDIFVMGSRAGGSATTTSDVDIGIRVPAEKFDELIDTSS